MKRIIPYLGAFCIVVIAGGCAFAQQKGPAEAVAQRLVETVSKGCDKEIQTFCKDVTPGEARVLACLYAHQDKLSGQCEYALYDAAAQLDRAVAAMSYLTNECGNDLKAYCFDIKPGEGRLLQCLDKNNAKVSGRCTQALKDTGLKK